MAEKMALDENGKGASALRDLAEKKLSKSPDETLDLKKKTPEEIIHELRVNQIELKIQNEELKRVQLELEASRGKYVDLYDLAPVGYLSVDSKGFILKSNLTAANRLGVARDSLIRKPLSGCVFKEDADTLYLKFKQALETRAEQTCELRLIKSDGSLLHTQFDIKATDINHVNIIFTDTSKRRVAEDSLGASERKYRMLFDVTPIGILLVNLEGEVLEVNRFFLQALGSPGPEATKTINVLTFPSMVKAGLSDLFRTCMTEKRPISTETLYTTKWGKETYLRIVLTPTLNEQGFVDGCLSVVEDVMHRKQAEQSQQESEEKYKALVETTDTGYLILNSQGKVTDANSEYLRLSGHTTLDEIIDRSVVEWTAEHHRERNAAEVTKCLEQGYVRSLEIDYVDKKGQITPVEINGTVVKIGQSFQIVALCRDISTRKRARDELEARVEERTSKLREANKKLELEIAERKRAELELQRSLQRLELILAEASRLRVQAYLASAAKSDFLTNMSHELRTPLTAVIGFSDLLGDQLFGKLNEKQLGYVKEISGAGRLLLILINDILDLAKVESGKMDIRMSPVDLRELLEHCLRMIRETAIKRGLNVSLRVSEEFYEGQIQADNVRLKQIVMNLLSNAVKFTPPGGTIRLEAERRGKEILVSVSDTGIGLKPDDQKRIFQAFEQLDCSFSRQEQGTGLGLALFSKLVELHGGRFLVESDGEGLGSTFSFFIPFIREEKDAEAQLAPASVRLQFQSPSDPSVEEKTRPKVLVVEDNESNMKFITDLLEDAGYEAIHAFSAETAIQQTEIEKPSLILVDISLPGMDGLTATKVLKSNPVTAHIPVVALTAHAMKDDESKTKEAGCDAYILKPIDTRIFYSALSRLIKAADFGVVA